MWPIRSTGQDSGLRSQRLRFESAVGYHPPDARRIAQQFPKLSQSGFDSRREVHLRPRGVVDSI
jgi:hypothetical protein